MSQYSPDSEAEICHDNAYVAHAQDTLNRRLHELDLQPLVHDTNWHRDGSRSDFHNRFAVAQYTYPQGLGSVPCPLPSSASDTSSMALTLGSHTETRSSFSAHAPSLAYCSTAQGSSVSTRSAGSIVKGGPIDEDGYLEPESLGVQSPVILRCSYSCLNCTKAFLDPEDWATHDRAHFGSRPPPRHLTCPFHCEWTVDAPSGDEAWEERRNHISSSHNAGAEEVDFWRMADPTLIQYLWCNRAIGAAQLKELRANGRLGQVSEAFLATAGTGPDRRREGRAPGGPGHGRPL